jgi:hypothetical protein
MTAFLFWMQLYCIQRNQLAQCPLWGVQLLANPKIMEAV